MPLTKVRLDPVRSAEPPTSSGVAGTSASSAFWLDWRVASFGLVSAMLLPSARATASCQPSGSLPSSARSNSARMLLCASRFSQARRAPAPRLPAACQRSYRSAGMVNGGSVQPSAAFAPAASVAPSAEPCTAAVPALVGAPKPMMVRQAISVGFLLRVANDSAAITCAGSWPSTRLVAQPCAANRFTTSSETASAVSPSIEMWLSSYSTVSLFSRRCPARPIASWLMPSIRSPSEAMTQVR